MIIEKYGIRLERLKEKDIELVRQHRNADTVRPYMDYRDYITPEMQLSWFQSINNIHNYFYLIEYKGDKIGLISGKNIDFNKRTSEGGIFIWNPDYVGGTVPVICSVVMTDLTFYLHHFNKNYAKILNSNPKSIRYNTYLGYVPSTDMSGNADYSWYELNPENYTRAVAPIRKGIVALTGDKSPLGPEHIHLDDEGEEDISRLYKGLPADVQAFFDHLLNRVDRS